MSLTRMHILSHSKSIAHTSTPSIGVNLCEIIEDTFLHLTHLSFPPQIPHPIPFRPHSPPIFGCKEQDSALLLLNQFPRKTFSVSKSPEMHLAVMDAIRLTRTAARIPNDVQYTI